MKTGLINISSNLGLDKVLSLNNFGMILKSAENMQGFLMEMEKTEQIKIQANALMHRSDNETKVAIKGFENKDLEIQAKIKENNQAHEKEMFRLQTSANERTMTLHLGASLIEKGKTEEGIELIKHLIYKGEKHA